MAGAEVGGWLPMSPKTLTLAAALLRAVLIAYGEWQDARMAVKYTDVDYAVFTDAARFLSTGGSPYDRATYRYTPLLAWMVLPNIYVHPCWGKVLFSAADIATGWLVYSILVRRGVRRRAAGLSMAAWLFNPFTAAISTRGNCEAVVAVLVLGMVRALMKKRVVLAAGLFGLAVHFRIFPIFYLPALLGVLGRDYREPPASKAGSDGGGEEGNPAADGQAAGGWAGWAARLVTRDRVVFSLTSGGVFVALAATFFWAYGYDFLHHTYLYHASRTDPRHNFSVHFYRVYLEAAGTTGGGGLVSIMLAALPTLSGLAVWGALAVKLYEDLTFCMLMTTCAFVAFNKVCTAQYFVWAFMLLPLCTPSTTMALWGRGGLCAAVWVAAQLLWLRLAYRLEFLGEDTFLAVWGGSVLFLACNVGVMLELMRGHVPTPLFRGGKICRLKTHAA